MFFFFDIFFAENFALDPKKTRNKWKFYTHVVGRHGRARTSALKKPRVGLNGAGKLRKLFFFSPPVRLKNTLKKSRAPRTRSHRFEFARGSAFKKFSVYKPFSMFNQWALGCSNGRCFIKICVAAKQPTLCGFKRGGGENPQKKKQTKSIEKTITTYLSF